MNCGHVLRGRSDKKFCDDQCRSAFHHARSGVGEAMVRSINYRLRKNRRILKGLVLENHSFSKDSLQHLGFDFTLFTSVEHDSSGAVRYYCYDYGYLLCKEGRMIRVFNACA